MMHRILAVGLAMSAALLLASCATPPSSAPGAPAADAPIGAALGSLTPGAPDREVIGQGTVIDTGDGPELCLGAVAESYPPQCAGVPLTGWSWDGIDGAETAGATTWGSYAVQGTYDGTALAVTQPPIMLALYDPMLREDPTGGRTGNMTEADVAELQEVLPDLLGEAYLGSSPEDGWLWIDVVWDDGTWQRAADEDFGADAVVVRSALVAVG